MTQDEYIKQTQHAVNLIKSMNICLGTNFCPDFAQSYADTPTLVQALNVLKDDVQETIDNLLKLEKIYSNEKEYNKFVEERSKCERGPSDIKWCNIPELARNELMDIYYGFTNGLNCVTREDHERLFNKSVEVFKNKYNITKIEI